MKINLILSFFVLFSLGSCQREEMKNENPNNINLSEFNNKWKDAGLDVSMLKSKQKITSYLFSDKAVLNLLRNPEAYGFRVVLGLTNGKLDTKLQCVKRNGVNLGIINPMVYCDRSFNDVINELENSNLEFSSSNNIAAMHLLQPAAAYGYLNRWNTELSENDNETLLEIVSYDNERIRYFNLKKEIVQEITAFEGFKYFGVFFGINPSGKLTTVMMGLNKDKKIILPSLPQGTNPNSSGAIYDFSQPCPSTCD
ncbi:hypothetical protein NAT51_16805 [Flavobacterium amniphilum]|uniref:hypothetical protein n=1 Tax=Flavobacterium amniphilum TaxID=1834035 RepID=UPI00202A2F0D|nr:hypothetical protein [Flavobacterium amniphilum]MCL9807196.1 hypothetical protein [Flavobacterium amniphilum]